MHRARNNSQSVWQWASRWFAIAALVVALTNTGCKTCALPRIDPTGQGLFAGTTTLDPQLGHLPAPQPAWSAPPMAQPCSGPNCKQHIKLHGHKLCEGIKRELSCDGVEGQLMVTPATVVAPVGSEVLILAGLCGPERAFVARQPIEFALSQESVGNFVAVGENGECFLTNFYKKQPQKSTGGYIRGVSSASEQVLSRGTADPTDDVRVGKGQTWVTVTSPSEGTSYITTVAPDARNWNQRRQTTTIHWVDAQWQFPTPASVPGDRHTLTTVVRRGAAGVPAAGWIVRYEVASGVAAGFGPQKQPVAEVPVDAQGNAAVDISKADNNGGSSTVSVQIMRPGLLGAAPMVVGQGFATVTWSAPGLNVQLSGPAVLTPNLEATYRLTVSNPGDIAATGVIAHFNLPPNIKFVPKNLPPQQVGNRYEWRLGDMAPHQQRDIDFILVGLGQVGGAARLQVDAQSANGVQARHELAITVAQQALDIQLAGPPTAFVGEQVQFELTVKNVGAQALDSVRLITRIDNKLRHSSGKELLSNQLNGPLQPGASEKIAITVQVVGEGKSCVQVEGSTTGGELLVKQACLDTSVKQVSDLQITLTADRDQVPIEGTVSYRMEVTNTGNKPLSNITIRYLWPASMQPTAATDKYEAKDSAISWTLLTPLEPNQRVTRQVTCQALKAEASAESSVQVSAQDVPVREQRINTRIVAGTGVMRVPVEEADKEEVVDPKGDLILSVKASSDAATVGDIVTYELGVTNSRKASDKQVKFRITLPENMTFVSFGGRYAATPVAPDNRVINVTPIAEMRPEETIEGLKLTVRATDAGKQSLTVEAVSERVPNGVRTEVPLKVSGK